MSEQKEITAPRIPTVKRLFAHSGNRCAFPRCTESLMEGETVVGEMCHIKGKKRDAARYDATQTAEERHGYDNLILLCRKHHTVVDDDEEAYTVERLLKMKADHEKNAVPVSDAREEDIAQTLIKNSVVSYGQSGGITAGVVNITVAPSVPSEKAALATARKFRNDRIDQIMAGNPMKELSSLPCMVVHAIPITPFQEHLSDNDFVQAALETNKLRLAPLGRSLPMYGTATGYQIESNRLGAITFSNRPKTPAYSQMFRSGAIEGVHILGETQEGKPYFHGVKLACEIVGSLRDYFRLMNDLGIVPPILVSVTLCHTKGCFMRYAHLHGMGWGDAGPTKEPKIDLPDAVIKEYSDDFPQALKRTFDVLWNTYNFPKCDVYKEDGQWNGSDALV